MSENKAIQKKSDKNPHENLFQHEPLKTSLDSIRLLTIDGTDKAGYLSCTLRESKVAQGNYYALSYVWGFHWPQHHIKVNGKLFPVTANVWTFLRYAVFELSNLEGTEIWLDALCINQADTVEKSSQIPLVGRIYEGAKKVFAWLPGEYCDRVMASPSSSCTKFDGPSSLARAMESDTIPEANGPVPSFIVESFVRLLQHPIWSRLWIVQEILLARKIEVLWEGQHISWPRLARLIEAVFYTGRQQTALSQYLRNSSGEANLGQLRTALPIFDFFTSDPEEQPRTLADDEDVSSPVLKDFSGIQKSRLGMNLVRSIQQYSSHDCSVIQDRVFAMLSICNDGQLLEPSYSESRFALLVRVLANHYRRWGRMLDERDCNMLTDVLELSPYEGVQLEWFHPSMGTSINIEKPDTSRDSGNDASDMPESQTQSIQVCDECMTYPLDNYKRLIWISSTNIILGTMDDWLSFQSNSKTISETVQAIFRLERVNFRALPTLHETASRGGIPFIPIDNSGVFAEPNCWYDLLGAAMPFRDEGQICPGRSSQSSLFSGYPVHVEGLVPGRRIGTDDNLEIDLDTLKI